MHVLPAKMPRVVVEQWRAILEPRPQANAGIHITVVVAVVVVVPPRAHKQVHKQTAANHHGRRRVAEARLQVDAIAEQYRREQQAAAFHHVIPIAAAEHGTARRPHVIVGHPNPARLVLGPVTGTPDVIAATVYPAARHPEVIVRGCGARRALLKAFRRRSQVGQAFGIDIGPETGNPTPSPIGLLPITGHPALPWRHFAPDAAHPDKVVLSFTPHPVAGDPGRIAFRHHVGRNLVDRFGRLVRNNLGRLNGVFHGAQECLVDGAAG